MFPALTAMRAAGNGISGSGAGDTQQQQQQGQQQTAQAAAGTQQQGQGQQQQGQGLHQCEEDHLEEGAKLEELGRLLGAVKAHARWAAAAAAPAALAGHIQCTSMLPVGWRAGAHLACTKNLLSILPGLTHPPACVPGWLPAGGVPRRWLPWWRSCLTWRTAWQRPCTATWQKRSRVSVVPMSAVFAAFAAFAVVAVLAVFLCGGFRARFWLPAPHFCHSW